MALNFAKALNIENQERSVVFLLLTQSVFLGIFAGALDVGANSLFLEAYSADLMPRAFMISGAVGIFFTSLYTYLQKKLPFKLFTILNLLVAIGVTALLRIGYGISDDPRLAFALLVMMGPVIIISMLGFWGTAGRYFTLREGKRLFGIIDTGSVVGMILAFYAVPILVKFNFNVYDTLLIGLGSLVIALLFQIIVLSKHDLIAVKVSTEKKRRTGFLNIFRKRYTSMMALFVVLSVITAFFVHYSFMWATEANYPDSKELTSFLGAFFGTMMIFTVVIKSTLYGWLMKNYGLRVTLLISPALLLILTVIASFVGGIFGYTAEAASFTLFFLVIALSKLFNKSLKDAIESPSMKILYQSLDSEERFDVQARIDGVVNELTAFSAGLIMAGLLFLSFITVIHFSYILIALLIIWVILGFSLYKSYRKTLNDSLASARDTKVSSIEPEEEHVTSIDGAPMYSEILKLDPLFYHSASEVELLKIIKSKELRPKKFAWSFISDTMFWVDEKQVKELVKSENDKELENILSDYSLRLKLPGNTMEDAFRSKDKNKVLAALHQIIQQNDISQVPHIISLLRDRNIQIRAAAIETAGKLKVKDLGSYLVDYLGHPELYKVTWSSLVKMGEMILENLENAFYKSGVEIPVQLRIVRAMVEIGGIKANAYLFSKINYHQREIRETAIRGIYQNDFLPDEKSKIVLKSMIYELAIAGAMNIAAEFVIRESNPGGPLLQAIVEERNKTNSLLFTLLGITYDKSSIEHVQKSIEDTENEDTGFALELLNLIIDDDVYAYLETYFDDLSVNEKIRRLQNEMPVEILPYDELLIDILNRDSLFTGNYIRVCAIEAINNSETLDAGQYLAAQIFHPNPIISKSASVALSGKNDALHKDVMGRLKRFSKENKRIFLQSEDTSGVEIISLVEKFKSWPIFNGLDREIIFRLASQIRSNGDVEYEDAELVSLIRFNGDTDNVFQKGIIINLSDYPSMFQQIQYLASLDKEGVFQIDKNSFIEFLFDVPEMHSICTRLFCSPETKLLFDTSKMDN